MDVKLNNVSFGARIDTLSKILPNSKKVSLKNLENLKGYVAFIGGDVFESSNKIVKRDLLFKNGKIIGEDVFDEKLIGSDELLKCVDLKGKVLTPSVLDEHIHGGYGINFNTADESQLRFLFRKYKEDGIGGVIATLLPGKPKDLNAQISLLNKIKESQAVNEAKLYGIHLEGPFFSPEKAGIHPPEILMLPTVENFLKLNSEGVKIVTIAPELDKNYSLSRYLAEHNIIASAGHSKASAQDLRNSGVPQVTHIFNAMAGLSHREPLTIANEALMNDKISTEMNSVFELLSPSVMDLITKLKPKDKVVLISDALPAANTHKPFKMNGIDIYLDENGVAKSKTGILAGSMQFLTDVAKKLVQNTRMTFEDFIRYASVNPARNLGVGSEFQLKIGSAPNFSIWDNKALKVDKVFVNYKN